MDKIIIEPITSMKNAFSVAGQNVVITGGNRGLGRGIAQAFAECGANVAILCRNEASGNEAAEQLRLLGSHAIGDPRAHPMPSYNASKAALDHLTRHLAIVMGDYGIRVNSIAPGPTHSDLDAGLPPSITEFIDVTMPMHRFGEPLEIGALAVFLASPAAAQITGVVANHDGGTMCVGLTF